jgi:organic radical activating enzyme
MDPRTQAADETRDGKRAQAGTRVRRGLRFVHTRWRELRMIVRGLASTGHPVLAHVIPIRRCNLSCGYCNEYDDFSKPVPLEEMFRRIDRLAELGVSIITQSGGEPLLHPDLDQIIARVRSHGVLAGMITNGYLLTRERIEGLNRAGLEHLQISIDNALPDEISKKSLKVLDQKLVLLAEYAEFQVNINSVLGSGVKNPEDALKVARRAQELGFTSTVGILHDGQGQLKPLGTRETEIFEEIMAMGKRGFSRLNGFQHNIAKGKPTTGAAAPARVTSTSARTAWCTGARSSAAIRAFPWKNIQPKICAASISRKNIAPRSAPFPACSKSPWSTTGAARRRSSPSPRRHRRPNRWCSCADAVTGDQ